VRGNKRTRRLLLHPHHQSVRLDYKPTDGKVREKGLVGKMTDFPDIDACGGEISSRLCRSYFCAGAKANEKKIWKSNSLTGCRYGRVFSRHEGRRRAANARVAH